MRVFRVYMCRIGIILCLTLFCVFLFSAQAEEAAFKAEQEPVKVGYYYSPLFQEGTADDVIKSGYAYQYLQKIGNLTGWQYTYVYGSWSDLFEQLCRGEIDLLTGVSYTSSRAENILYPREAMGEEKYIVYCDQSDTMLLTGGPGSLEGVTVGVIKNSMMADELITWTQEKDIQPDLVYFEDLESCRAAFSRGEIRCICSTENNISGFANAIPLLFVGSSSYFLAVSVQRDDLLMQLNAAQAYLNEAEPYFLSGLEYLCFGDVGVNTALSSEEEKWVEEHGCIRVGYIRDYEPFSWQDEQGQVKGILTDVMDIWMDALSLQEKISVEYAVYETYDDMIEGLDRGEIDVIFPQVSSLWHSEQSGISETKDLIAVPVSLIFSGEYNVTKLGRIAISGHSPLQKAYVEVYYPEAQILAMNSVEECLQAVMQGLADSTVFTSYREEYYLAKASYSILRSTALENGCSYAMGVKRGNTVVLGLMEKGLQKVDKTHLFGLMMNYMNDIHPQSFADFIKANFVAVLASAAAVFVLIIGSLSLYLVQVIRSRRTLKKTAQETEALNQELNTYQEELKHQLAVINATSHRYFSVYDITIPDHHYRRVFAHSRLLQGIPGEGDALPALERGWKKMVQPEDREKMAAFLDLSRWQEYLDGRDVVSCEYRGITSGWSEARLFAAKRDETGKVIQAVYTLEMIHEQKEAEQQLKDHIQVIGGLSNAFSLLYKLNLETETFRAVKEEPSARQLIKDCTDVREALQRFLSATVYENDEQMMREFVDIDTLKERLLKKNHLSAEYQLKQFQAWFHVEWIVATRDEQGNAQDVLFTLQDATHIVQKRIKQKQELQRARNAAQAASEAKSRFLFNMSHDIRTPLNAILGYTELLDKPSLDEHKRTDYLNKVRDSGKFLLSLINNVLEMARIENGCVTLDEAVHPSNEVGKMAYSVYSGLMQKKQISFMYSEDLLTQNIYCDQVKTNEILMNLISNAYKYTPEGGRVSLSLNELPCDKPGYMQLQMRVADTGVGMSEEYLPKLFEEFTREESHDGKKTEGTGLGMPIVKRLVELMGGTIQVKSNQGRGTVITVSIPFRKAEPNVKQGTLEADGEVPHFPGMRVLLTDDNDMNAEIGKMLLGDLEIASQRARDGVECLEMLKNAAPSYYDAVLMDIQMPHMNGYEAARKIRSLNDPEKAHIPLLAMTANAFEEDIRDAQAAGMDGHVAKPIDIRILAARLKQIWKV